MSSSKPLSHWLQLPALDRAPGLPDPRWVDAFARGGALAGRTVDLVVVAGLGTQGTAAEVERGADLLQRLVAPLDPHPVRIWPVPGPGDRDPSRASKLLRSAYQYALTDLFDGGDTAGLMLAPFAAWNAARKRLVGTPLSPARPWIAQPLEVRRLRIGLFGLNSAWLPDGKPIAAAGVARPGLDGLAARRRPDLVVAALHHPPAALWNEERDALAALLAECDVVLHDGEGLVAKGSPVALGVAPGRAHWITVFDDRVEVALLDPARGLAPTGEVFTVPLPRRLAVSATPVQADGWPPDADGLIDHLALDWGQVVLTGLVEGDDDGPKRVDEVFVSLRVDAPVDPGAMEPRRGRRGIGDGIRDDFDTIRKASQAEDATDSPTAAQRALVAKALKHRGLPHAAEHIGPAWVRLRRAGGDREQIEAALTAHDIEQAIGAHRWLLIEGDPGTGKTTTVQAVVVALLDALRAPDGDPRHTARARAFGFTEPWPVPLPIYFRRFWRWLDATPDDGRPGEALLAEYLGHQLGGYAGGSDWIAPLLAAGRALLIFDGLDEMPRDLAQARAVATVRDAARRLAGNRCVVTSRPSGLVDGVRDTLRAAGLHTVRLRPLAPDQVEAFVGRWYHQLLPPASAEAEAADLVARIRANRLDELARVPITLVAMAVVHRSSRLPERRVELYEQCIKALLHRWHQRFTEDYARAYLCGALSEGIKLRIAQTLAHLAHGAGGDQAVLDQRPVLEAVHATLPEKQRAALPDDDPEACAPLVETLSDRSGLIVREGRWGWRFRHRAFQEYLTARHLCHTLAPEAFVARLDEALDQPDWHGVVPLALAYQTLTASTSGRASVAGLLDRAHRRSTARAVAAAAVVGRALCDLRHYDPPWLAEVVEPWRAKWAGWIDDIAQPGAIADRIAVAETLGWFGDPRLGWGEAQFPWVPAGPYIAGTVGEKVWRDDHDREDDCHVDAFRVGHFPVTVGQFLEFVDHPDFGATAWWTDGGLDDDGRRDAERRWRDTPPNRPVTEVTWYEAVAFCRWASAHRAGSLGAGDFALPTEREWEKAARGGATVAADELNPAPERQYPWAEPVEPDAERANFGVNVGRPTPVGLYPKGRGPYGACDQAGNVWQWCHNRHTENRSPRRVVRGGGWGNHPQDLRVSYRDGGHPAGRGGDFGFRCVWRARPPRSLGA